MEDLSLHLMELGVAVSWYRETRHPNAEGGYDTPTLSPLDIPDPRILLNATGATVHQLPGGSLAAGEATVHTTHATADLLRNGDRFTTPTGERYVINGPVSISHLFDGVRWHAEREP